MAKLDGKVAIVTAGANGIGKAAVEALANEGADVAICDIDVPRLESVAAEVEAVGRKAMAESIDVTDWSQVNAMTQRVVENLGSVDILVPAAGGSGTSPTYVTHDAKTGEYIYRDEGLKRFWFEDVLESDWDATMDLNLKAVFLCCKAAIPWMKRQKSGAIVTLSSIAGSIGMPSSAFAFPAYIAAKLGVIGLTRHIAREQGAFGIRANCVSPSYVGTERMEPRSRRFDEVVEQAKAKGEEVPQDMALHLPIRRASTAEEQGRAVAFLASDDASFINGVTLDVNGGAYMR